MICLGVFFLLSFFFLLLFLGFSSHLSLFLVLLIQLGLAKLFGSMVCLFLENTCYYFFTYFYHGICSFFSFCDSIFTLDHLILSYGSSVHCSCFVRFCFRAIFLLCVSVWLLFMGLSVSSLIP